MPGLDCWLMRETRGLPIAPDDSQPAFKVELPVDLAADHRCESMPHQDQQACPAGPSLNGCLLNGELQIDGSCFKPLSLGSLFPNKREVMHEVTQRLATAGSRCCRDKGRRQHNRARCNPSTQKMRNKDGGFPWRPSGTEELEERQSMEAQRGEIPQPLLSACPPGCHLACHQLGSAGSQWDKGLGTQASAVSLCAAQRKGWDWT